MPRRQQRLQPPACSRRGADDVNLPSTPHSIDGSTGYMPDGHVGRFANGHCAGTSTRQPASVHKPPRMEQAISDGRRGRRPRRGPTAASITRKHSQFCSICSWCPVHRLQRHCTWDESGQAGRRVAVRSRSGATISSDGAACVRGHGREHRAPRPQPTTLLMRLPPVGAPEGIEKHLTPQSTTCAAWGGSCRRWSCSSRRERRPTAP
jgi:hypothetical protein